MPHSKIGVATRPISSVSGQETVSSLLREMRTPVDKHPRHKPQCTSEVGRAALCGTSCCYIRYLHVIKHTGHTQVTQKVCQDQWSSMYIGNLRLSHVHFVRRIHSSQCHSHESLTGINATRLGLVGVCTRVGGGVATCACHGSSPCVSVVRTRYALVHLSKCASRTLPLLICSISRRVGHIPALHPAWWELPQIWKRSCQHVTALLHA